LKERSFEKFNTKNYREVKEIDIDDIFEDDSDEDIKVFSTGDED